MLDKSPVTYQIVARREESGKESQRDKNFNNQVSSQPLLRLYLICNQCTNFWTPCAVATSAQYFNALLIYTKKNCFRWSEPAHNKPRHIFYLYNARVTMCESYVRVRDRVLVYLVRSRCENELSEKRIKKYRISSSVLWRCVKWLCVPLSGRKRIFIISNKRGILFKRKLTRKYNWSIYLNIAAFMRVYNIFTLYIYIYIF